MTNIQEPLRFDENHVHLHSDEDIEAEFTGHPELIEEFKRRLALLKAAKKAKDFRR